MDSPPIQEPLQSRVCDSCIRRKVKCDQHRPACSQCSVRGDACNYTIRRRRPGPARGSRKRPRSARSDTSPRHQCPDASSSGPSEGLRPQNTNSRSEELVTIRQPNYAGSRLDQVARSAMQFSLYLNIDSQQESDLLERFFDIIKDANPIFSKKRFLHAYQNALCSHDLISTIVTLTAKLTGYLSRDTDHQLNTRMDHLLSQSLLADEVFGDLTLDQFRKSCLLAFYDFHQNPGSQSWARIGQLTRLAYRQGLDRLDRPRTLYPDWALISKEDLNEWRSVWWCIYRLDSYSNLSSGTPYLIDESLVKTSLIVGQQTLPELFLPSQPENLWDLFRAIASDTETLLTNVDIITVTALRQAGRLIRARSLRSIEESIACLINVEQAISRLCLALPSGWLNPRRNVFSNEPPDEYHARLVTVLHLRMVKLLLAIIHCDNKEGNEWLKSWERVLEACQDIASVAEHWESSFSLAVDPAISFIFFVALTFLSLHQKTASVTESNLASNIDHGITILRLQLEQFASVWSLTRLLILAYKSFDEVVADRLSYRHVALVVSRFEVPLHPRWLHSLSSTQEDLESVM